MKNKFLYILTTLAVMAVGFVGCDDKEGRLVNDEDKAPERIDESWIKSVQGTHGGAFIVFNELPQESNFLYVEARYKVDHGEYITKTMSAYSDTLFINGLGKRQNAFGEYEYEVELRAVSRGGAKSEPTPVLVNPLEPNITLVSKTLSVKNSFSSLIVNGVNTRMEDVDICVILASDPDYKNKVTRVTSSRDSLIYITINNLAEQDFYVATYTKDRYNNYSDTTEIFDPLHPLTDEYLVTGSNDTDKYQWTFLDNAKLYGEYWDIDSLQPKTGYRGTYTKDSMRNASTSYIDAKIEYFWDGVTETDGMGKVSYFSTGPNTQGILTPKGTERIEGYWAYPYSYFIDLGRTVELSRVTVWQHSVQGGVQPYASYNTKTFELWGRPEMAGDSHEAGAVGSNRLTGWFKIGTYTIHTPSSTNLQAAEAEAGHSFAIFDSDDPTFSKPLRYLRFKGVTGFGFDADKEKDAPGSPYQGTMSEIALFGRNVGE